jgi:hypothetical protein
MILFAQIAANRPPAGVVALRRDTSCWARLLESLFATIERIVPLGYEDASGFHYGRPALD